VVFDQKRMRNHLLNSLKENSITTFLTCTNAITKCKKKEIKLDIYCSCRMIWAESDKNIFGKNMVECLRCLKWYHRMCENKNERILIDPDAEWFCSICNICKSS